MVDVDPATFEVSLEHIMAAYTKRTKAIIPVHLFGQNCDMEPIMQFARSHGLYVIEDAAQSIGSEYIFSDGKRRQSGTMGDVGCTSFFPTKNLGCYGDGGAMFTNDPDLAARLKMIANHGQKQKYHHSVIGCNSRLDTIQAAVLDVKLRHLGEYCMERRAAADYYTACIKEWDPDCRFAETPVVKGNTTHVFHQYTLKIKNGQRDGLKKYLNDNGIAAMIYYPLPLNRQKAFEGIAVEGEQLYNAAALAKSVLSLPVDTEITRDMQDVVLKGIFDYFETGK
jgi:dTDP-4-amino-4,6-dideoxygalactose transaminase